MKEKIIKIIKWTIGIIFILFLIMIIVLFGIMHYENSIRTKTEHGTIIKIKARIIEKEIFDEDEYYLHVKLKKGYMKDTDTIKVDKIDYDYYDVWDIITGELYIDDFADYFHYTWYLYGGTYK